MPYYKFYATMQQNNKAISLTFNLLLYQHTLFCKKLGKQRSSVKTLRFLLSEHHALKNVVFFMKILFHELQYLVHIYVSNNDDCDLHHHSVECIIFIALINRKIAVLNTSTQHLMSRIMSGAPFSEIIRSFYICFGYG